MLKSIKWKIFSKNLELVKGKEIKISNSGRYKKILEKELKLEKSKAELVASEITRFVFLPVRNSLEALYKMKISPSIKPGSAPSPPEDQPTADQPKAGKSKKSDSYREPTE